MKVVAASTFVIVVVTGTASASDVITFAATNGQVVFNHKKHSDGRHGCKTCHDRKGGKIRGVGKEWAHKVCRGCHEAMMAGPTKCPDCHDERTAFRTNSR